MMEGRKRSFRVTRGNPTIRAFGEGRHSGADPRALSPAEVARRQRRRGVSCRRYQPDFHQALLTAPEYMLDAIAGGQVVTDASPMMWEA